VGQENIPTSGAVIIVGNQDNVSAALATEAALRRKISWAVSPAICRSKLLRFFLKIFWRCFSLNPEHPDIKGFRFAFKVLKKSGVLTFYPGGIHQGMALFCLRAGCNILPMAITQNALNHRRIKITFGPIYNLSEYQDITVNVKTIKDVIQRINQSIESLKDLFLE
jgi:1-acyl-sn-glycerol-3-phosphate acyltransferase